MGKLWLLSQLHELISCNSAAQARAVYKQDQDPVAMSLIVTDSRDGIHMPVKGGGKGWTWLAHPI